MVERSKRGFHDGAEQLKTFDFEIKSAVSDGNKASIPRPHREGTVPGFLSLSVFGDKKVHSDTTHSFMSIRFAILLKSRSADLQFGALHALSSLIDCIFDIRRRTRILKEST